MSLNIKENGALRRIAGSTVILDATAAEIREGIWTNTEIDTATGDTRIEANITFDVPLLDTNYMVVFDKPVTGHGESYNYVNVSTKTTTGFTFFVTYTGNLSHTPLGLQIHWYAVRLVKLEDYTALQNKVSNPDSTPTENSTNLVTSGGVYDAISSASKIFVNSESAWNELDAETKATYQVAIFTDKPNVNAVDSTDGSTTVVGEPNKRWSGTTEEWEQFEADYPEEAAKIEVRFITDDSETGTVVDAVEDGNMKAVTSNAVYDAIAPINTVETIPVTTNNNFSVQDVSCKKVGRIIILNFRGHMNNVALSTDVNNGTILGSIPAAYAPKSTVSNMIQGWNGALIKTALTVNTSGNILSFGEVSTNNQFMWGQVSWVLED